MKFARYLQDNQTPEWKRAYIDYDTLKAHIKVIRANAPPQVNTSGCFKNLDVVHPHHSALGKRLKIDVGEYRGSQVPTSPALRGMNNQPRSPFTSTLDLLPRGPEKTSGVLSHKPPICPTNRCAPVSGVLEDPGLFALPPLFSPRSDLPATHVKFFEMLDAELNKVETFYSEREREMQESARILRKQVNELEMHREMFHASPLSLPSSIQRLPELNTKIKKQGCRNNFLDSELGYGRHNPVHIAILGTQAPERARLKGTNYTPRWNAGIENGSKALNGDLGKPYSKVPDDSTYLCPGKRKHYFNPKEYQDAKRTLGKAMLEHYRGLEILNNYRIINLAGFRRALKHYEWITKTPVLDVYMKGKVEPSAFASGAMVRTMLEEIEHLFEMRFECGDRKKAVEFLRVGPLSKTHHSSTFQSGLMLGLAFTAIAGGIYLSFQEQTRISLPSWNILLFIYSIFALPVLLALLIGINILVWVRKRINYAFILELNPSSRLDHHQYFELPSFLLCTLASAFWFSMAQIGPPMMWPLIWLALTLVVMFNPIRSFMWGHARWWAIKNIAKLGTSGFWKVEFTDVWLGDQTCSLVYSISNLFFVGCTYRSFFHNFPGSAWEGPVDSPSLYISTAINVTNPTSAFHNLLSSAYDSQIQDVWSTCSVSQNIGWYCLLGMLPFLVRLVQNVRRYRDSRALTHLVNAGKYMMGVIYCLVYCFWKHQGTAHSGKVYVLWCFTGTVNSIYGCAWDFFMDWSMCNPRAKYPLLRQELVYESQIPCYYFALLSNICIRFLWLNCMFADEANVDLYAFIAALLEILRRVQWNFYRLENEHLAHMHLFRDMHEAPLPYRFDVSSDGDEKHEKVQSALSWLKQQLVRSKTSGGYRKKCGLAQTPLEDIPRNWF